MVFTKEKLQSHIEYILKYWRRAVDFENGGINFQVENFEKGIIYQDKKCLLMHARQLYDFSVGLEKGLIDSENVAEHLYRTLDLVFPKDKGLYHSFNFSSYQDETDILSSYDNLYLVIALARYARATNDQGVYSKAKEHLSKIREVFADDQISSRGYFAIYHLRENRLYGKTGNVILHFFEAIINLRLAAKLLLSGQDLKDDEIYLDELVGEILELFFTRIFDQDLKMTYEFFNDDFSLSNQQKRGYVTAAHALEWFGFIYEYSILDPQKSHYMKDFDEKFVDSLIERFVDQSGFLKNEYYIKEEVALPKSSFWSQTEATLGVAFASRCFKNRSYLEVSSRMFDFYIANFIDEEFGGIYSDLYLEHDKVIIENRNKGFSMKCDHHSLRMCEKIIDNVL